MSSLFPILIAIVGLIICFAVYAIIKSKLKAKTKMELMAKPMLDDTSYIEDMKRNPIKWGYVTWQQYDFLLAAQPYYWETMVDCADYIETVDFDSIESMTIGAPGEQDIELAHVYNQNKVGLKNFDRLAEEQGSLSIAGHSHTLKDSVKIVWFNQLRVLRLFTDINDETLITRYVETVIRRTFGTPDAMKLAKPVTKEASNPISSNDSTLQLPQESGILLISDHNDKNESNKNILP